jgi:DNA-binding response OmpR family regulator
MTRILVIDDDPAVRTAIRTLLERRGIEVLVADNGATGIKHLEYSTIDAAIVDIFMPDMDGLEIVRTFGRRAPNLPVIVMSGLLSGSHYGTAPDFLNMASKLGAAFCLRKPFQPDQLMAAIAACLGRPLEGQNPDAGEMSSGERTGRRQRDELRTNQ